MSHGRGISLALTAGVMAALGSTSAKLAMTAEAVRALCGTVLSAGSTSDDETSSLIVCDSITVLLRVICFGGVFVFNALMWIFYTKSLQFCSSTVEATVTNTAANFFFTAVVGGLLFDEHFTALWFVGSCLILAGLVLIHQGSTESEQKDKKHK